MKTTNCCIVFLTGCVLLSFFGCAHSLKCYKCIASSKEECSANQTIIECPHSAFRCATVQYNKYGPTYLKDCLPLAHTCASIVDATNCSVDHCLGNYCNGPTPTTSPQKPSVTASSEAPTTKLTYTTTTESHKTEQPKAAGSLLSSGYGLMAFVFVFGKILETCDVS